MTLAIMILMMMATEKVVGRIGPKSALVIGLGVLGLALMLFARMPVGGSFAADVLLPSLLGAIGMSLAYIPAMITSTATARPEDGGLASGLVNTTYQVGSAIGLAAMVAVAGSKTSSLVSAGIDPTAAMNDGFSAAFVGAAIIAFLAATVAIRIPRANRQHAAIAVMLFVAIAVAACGTSSSHDAHDERGSAVATEHARQPAPAPAPAPATPPDAAVDSTSPPDARLAEEVPASRPAKPVEAKSAKQKPATPVAVPAAVVPPPTTEHSPHGHHIDQAEPAQPVRRRGHAIAGSNEAEAKATLHLKEDAERDKVIAERDAATRGGIGRDRAEPRGTYPPDREGNCSSS